MAGRFTPHLAAWFTAGFAVLLFLLSIAGEAGGPQLLEGSLLLFVVSLGIFALGFRAEFALHARRGRARQP